MSRASQSTSLASPRQPRHLRASQGSPVTLDDLALLRYSSGSSGSPHGVMVSHANLMANEAMINEAFEHSASTVFLSWPPFQHDMGLIGMLLYRCSPVRNA